MADPIGTTTVLFDKAGQRILLGVRKNGYGAGTYGMPGGRLDGAEPLIESAKRELLEETGVRPIKLEQVGFIREFQGENNFIHFVFSCIEYEGEPVAMEPDKCLAWEWHRLDQLPANILPGHYWAIELCKNPHPSYRDIYENSK